MKKIKISVMIFLLIAIFASINLLIMSPVQGATISFSIADNVSKENFSVMANVSQTINATSNSQIELTLFSNATGSFEVAEFTSDPERNSIG